MSWGNEFGKLRRGLNENIYELYEEKKIINNTTLR